MSNICTSLERPEQGKDEFEDWESPATGAMQEYYHTLGPAIKCGEGEGNQSTEPIGNLQEKLQESYR